MIIDININKLHMDPSNLNLPDLLRTRNDAAARLICDLHCAEGLSERTLYSPTTMYLIEG